MPESKPWWILPSALAGLLGAVGFAILWTSAVVADGHWIFGVETLSELGGDRPGKCLFNTGVVLAGMMMVAFTPALYTALRKDWMSRIGCALVLVASAALVGIGLFPITAGSVHTSFSWAFFSLFMIALLALIWPVRRSKVMGKVGLFLTVAAPVVSIIVLVGTMLVPMAEPVAVISIMLWGGTTSVLILTRGR